MNTNKDKVELLLAIRPDSKVYYYDKGLSYYIEDEIPEGVQLYVEDEEDEEEGFAIEDYL